MNVLFSALSLQSRGTTNEQTYTWLLYTLMIVPSIVTILFTFVNESYSRSFFDPPHVREIFDNVHYIKYTIKTTIQNFCI